MTFALSNPNKPWLPEVGGLVFVDNIRSSVVPGRSCNQGLEPTRRNCERISLVSIGGGFGDVCVVPRTFRDKYGTLRKADQYFRADVFERLKNGHIHPRELRSHFSDVVQLKVNPEYPADFEPLIVGTPDGTRFFIQNGHFPAPLFRIVSREKVLKGESYGEAETYEHFHAIVWDRPAEKCLVEIDEQQFCVLIYKYKDEYGKIQQTRCFYDASFFNEFEFGKKVSEPALNWGRDSTMLNYLDSPKGRIYLERFEGNATVKSTLDIPVEPEPAPIPQARVQLFQAGDKQYCMIGDEYFKAEVFKKIEDGSLPKEDLEFEFYLSMKKFQKYMDGNKRSYLSGGNGEIIYLDEGDEVARYVIDPVSKKKYLNEPLWLTRLKCFLLALVECTGVLAVLMGIGKRLIGCEDKKKNAEVLHPLKLLARILLSPLFLIVALGGIFEPRIGRAAYAQLEELLHGSWLMAPCFQPDANEHLFAGKITDASGTSAI